MIINASWWMMVVLGGSVPVWHIGGSDRQACLGGCSGCHSGHGLHVRASETMSSQPSGSKRLQTDNGWQFFLFIYSFIYIYIKGLTPPAADPRFTPVVELDVFLWLTPRPGWGPTGQLPFCLNDALLWTFDRELPGQMCCGRHARTWYLCIYK